MFTVRSQIRTINIKDILYNNAHSKCKKFLFILFSLPRKSCGVNRGFFILFQDVELLIFVVYYIIKVGVKMKIKVNKNKSYGKWCGFGASGAWWAQIVGGWEHIDEKSGMAVRDRISQLLYSKKNGIGLNIYRYNVGAGSLESGNGDIGNPSRRTECFLDEKDEYDFSKDANAVYMMHQAAKDGADEIIMFVNSPLEKITKNGWSHLGKWQIMRDNLAKINYDEFANYTLDVAEHFVKEGLPIKYISPVNEPIWIWNGGQEGCHYSPWSVAEVMRVFAIKMEHRKALDDVKLSGVESGDIRWFNKSYTRALMKHKCVRDRIDAVDVHSYFLKFPIPLPTKCMDDRHGFLTRYRKWLDKKYPDLPVKMSEWCHMQGGRDSTMMSGLVCANVIYDDIKLLNVCSWQHWIAVSEVDYCDGLIYINLDTKTFEMTKRYYVTGNFSKYIPMGAEKIAAECDDNDLKILAFYKDGKTTVVIINNNNTEKTVSVSSKNDVLLAVTNETYGLKEIVVSPENIKISPRSVNTVVF